MKKKTKIPQIYGYAVIIVAMVTILISLTDLITSVIDASDPLYKGFHSLKNMSPANISG